MDSCLRGMDRIRGDESVPDEDRALHAQKSVTISVINSNIVMLYVHVTFNLELCECGEGCNARLTWFEMGLAGFRT